MSRYYLIQLPAGAQLHLSYHEKPDPVVLQYRTPAEAPPPGTSYVRLFEVRLPLGSQVRVMPAEAGFKVELVESGNTSIQTDPISSIYSPWRP